MSETASASTDSIWTRLARRALVPVSIGPLVWFRVLFGVIMMVEVWRYFEHDWIKRYFIAPTHHFTYYGFSWVHPWAGEGMKLHFLALGVLAFCIAAGFLYRIATVLFFFGFTYVFLLDQARYLNHFYFVCLLSFLMIFVPAHRAGSFDAWLRPSVRAATVPVWTVWLLRFQLCVVYFFGGIAKLNADWLHGEPMRMWLAASADAPVVGQYFTHPAAPYFFSYAGLAFDLLIAPMLWWRRTRYVAFAGAVIFNLTNAYLFTIGIFPWLALGASVVLFLPRLPFFPAAPEAEPGRAPLRTGQRVTLALLCGYVAFQVLVPLRQWLYPGNVQWTEEGHRFSWRMKLRNKEGSMAVLVTDPATHFTRPVELNQYAANWQLNEAVARPDMLLQLAHMIAEDERLAGRPNAEVRIDATAQLNGRPEQPLIDPKVDLARVERSLKPADWIVPLTTPLPEATGAAKRLGSDRD